MKRFLAVLAAFLMCAVLYLPASAAGFKDIPADSSLADEINKAVSYGLMNGYSSTTFGYHQNMTRAQFTAVLVRMFGWETSPGETVSFSDVSASHNWFSVIETAVRHDVIDPGGAFHPSDGITRAEMAEMLVRALGYKGIAHSINSGNHGTPFTDLPKGREGYIAVAYTIGMTNGMTATTFAPNNFATRAQAAAMMVRIYEKLHRELDQLHGFYAISSNSQISLCSQMDIVSVGWSRMLWDGSVATLSTTSAAGNEYFIPSGYSSAVNNIVAAGTDLQLCVFMDAPAALLASEQGRGQAISQIIHELTVPYRLLGRNPYTGVTIDFEGLRSDAKENFNLFLDELSRQLDSIGKNLSVCVSPVLSAGPYYDGYDYHTIGQLADQVILMAYDYSAQDLTAFVGSTYYKTTALTPIDAVFASLRAVADPETGVSDRSKILLGFSCKNTAWEIDADDRLLSGTPVFPSNDTVSRRLAQPDTVLGWSDTYQNPYAIYTTEDGRRYFLWYEDNRSIQTKMDLAKLLQIPSASVWRLGIIPGYDNWNWNRLWEAR